MTPPKPIGGDQAREMLRLTMGKPYPIQVTRWLAREALDKVLIQFKRQRVKCAVAYAGKGRYSVWRELLPGDTPDLLSEKYPDLFVE